MESDVVTAPLSSPKIPRQSQDLLPTELWSMVFECCLYRPNDFSPDLQWEDVSGLQVDIEDAQETFKESLFLVSRQFYVTAFSVVKRYLVFTSQTDIDSCLNDITRGTAISDDDVGAWTWRLDLHIAEGYTPTSLTTLFQRIPNLHTLVVRNTSLGRFSEYRFRPDTIVHCLGRFCKSLKRLQFESVGEEPTVRLLKDILRLLPFLQTLHIDSAYCPAQGDDDNGDAIVDAHTALTTLSIGSVRRRYHTVTGLMRVGVFLTACIKHHALPNLRVLHLQKAVPLMAAFLDKYSPQLQEFGYGAGEIAFTAGYHWDNMDTYHPHITSYCPNITRLVLVTTEWPMFAPIRPLIPHLSVQDITIVYVKPEGATGGGRGAVVLALRVIDATLLTALKKITVATLLGMAAIEAGDGWFTTVRDMQEKGVVINTIVLTEGRYIQSRSF